MARPSRQEEGNREAVSSCRATEVDEVEAEETLAIGSGVTSAGAWDIQLRVVPCAFRVNKRSIIEEAQEASHGGHPEQAGVVLATEDEDRHGQPQ